MNKLGFPTWIQSAWECLVKSKSKLAADSINRIQRLARAHAHDKQSRETDRTPNDFRGRGKGLTFLPHGPPGIGKAMLAECLSGEHQRPLYRVNLRMPIFYDSWESTTEEIFRVPTQDRILRRYPIPCHESGPYDRPSFHIPC
ncbi:hypothetical protein F4815DRAFT_457985 [Daldinia loculata]|nr:hypothetical protein F4815DRAFT_457985 [Daldinia loculata]